MTDFARGLRESFARLGEPPARGGRIGLLRQAAFARFAELGLPTLKDEEWKYTSLAPLARIDFTPPAAQATPPRVTLEQLDLLAGGPPGDGAVRLVFLDGRYKPELSSRAASGGTFIGSLAAAIAERPELVDRELARHADHHHDPLTSFHQAFFRGPHFLFLAAGAALRGTIYLLLFSTATG